MKQETFILSEIQSCSGAVVQHISLCIRMVAPSSFFLRAGLPFRPGQRKKPHAGRCRAAPVEQGFEACVSASSVFSFEY